MPQRSFRSPPSRGAERDERVRSTGATTLTLITGEITEISTDNDTRIARVRVGGAYTRAWLEFLKDAKIGDIILIEGGVAIGKVEPGQEKENPYVPGNSR